MAGATYRGKLALVVYNSDSDPEATRDWCNHFIGYEGTWTQCHTWKLGDGDPGICISEGIEENDPRVLAALSALGNQIAEGDFDSVEVVYDRDFARVVVQVELEDVIVLTADIDGVYEEDGTDA